VNAIADKANLKFAIESWARDAERLFVYLIGHGLKKQFQIDTDQQLSDVELDNWLDAGATLFTSMRSSNKPENRKRLSTRKKR